MADIKDCIEKVELSLKQYELHFNSMRDAIPELLTEYQEKVANKKDIKEEDKQKEFSCVYLKAYAFLLDKVVSYQVNQGVVLYAALSKQENLSKEQKDIYDNRLKELNDLYASISRVQKTIPKELAYHVTFEVAGVVKCQIDVAISSRIEASHDAALSPAERTVLENEVAHFAELSKKWIDAVAKNDEKEKAEILQDRLLNQTNESPITMKNGLDLFVGNSKKELLNHDGLRKQKLRNDKIHRLQDLEKKRPLSQKEIFELMDLRSYVCSQSDKYKAAMTDLHNCDVNIANASETLALISRRSALNIAAVQKSNTAIKADVTMLFDLEIERLRKKRFASYSIFCRGKQTDYLNLINGLVYLRNRYNIGGYHFIDAKRALQAENKAVYSAMYKEYGKTLYKKVVRLDSDKIITPDARGFIDVAGECKDETSTVTPERLAAITGINKQIDILENELKKCKFFKQTKTSKKNMLKDLHDHLENYSFDKALSLVQEKHRKSFRLLFEGRTGVFVKDLERDCYSKEDRQRLINVEIKRLENVQAKGFSIFVKWFGKAKIKNLQKEIDALKALSVALRDDQVLENDHWVFLSKKNPNILLDAGIGLVDVGKKAAV